MNIDKDNNKIQNESTITAFSDVGFIYKLKKSNLPIKLKVMLIKRLNEITVSPLHLAVIDNNIQEVKNILAKDKSMLGLKDRWGSTALHYAVELALLDITKYLIEEGANVFERNSDGDTLLHLATIEGNKDMINYLLEKGLDINVLDDRLQAPLHWAVLMDKKETLIYLVEKGANINIEDEYKMTPLHIAYEYERYDIATYLVEKGADVNSKDSMLRTPIYWSIIRSDKNQLEYLVKKGAKLDIENRDKKTLLHIALMGKTWNFENSVSTYLIEKVVTYLIEKGVDINAQDIEGKTALHSAVEMRYYKVVKILLEKDADSNIIDNKGKKAIHYMSFMDEVKDYEMICYIASETYLDNDEKYRRQNRALLYKIILNSSIKVFESGLIMIGSQMIAREIDIDDYFSLRNYKVMLINSEIKDKEMENYIWNRMKELEKKEEQSKEDEKGTDVDKGLIIAAGFLEYLLLKTDRKENVWYVHLIQIVNDINKFLKRNYLGVYIRKPGIVREEKNMAQTWRLAFDELGIKKEKLSSEEMFEVMIEFVILYNTQYNMKELVKFLKGILELRDKYNDLWKVWEYYIEKAEGYKVIQL